MISKNQKPSLYKIITSKAYNQLTLFDNWLTAIQRLLRHGAPIGDTQELSAITAIQLFSDFKEITIRLKSSTGAPVTSTADPQMGIGVDGQVVVLEGVDSTATFTVVHNNGFKLAGGVAFTLAKYDLLVLQYSTHDSLWLERSRSKNS